MLSDPNNLSYRDTVARIVEKNNIFQRYIFYTYKQEYDHLMNSGLYSELVKKGLLIDHKEIKSDIEDNNIYKLILPKQIAFQSYPFEWTFSQWKNTIIAFLKINKIALKYGMILKDASPYNYYLIGDKAIMFDTTSFEFYPKNGFWRAYNQFCKEMLSPLALIYYKGQEWSKLSLSNFRGIEINFASLNLPVKSWFNISILLNIHLHSKYTSKKKRLTNQQSKNNLLNAHKLEILLDIIQKNAEKMHPQRQWESDWSEYYEEDIESLEYLREKELTINNWLKKIKPNSVLDLGANTGRFSFIASQYTNKVIALDYDPKCIEYITKKVSDLNVNNIFTLVGNIAEPSPTLGYFNSETISMNKRLKSQLVLCLALFHHLIITNKLSFKQTFYMLNEYCNEYLIIEYVPKDDKKFLMISEFSKIYLKIYTLSNFKTELMSYFNILEEKPLNDSGRILFLLKKNK